ncbi:aminoglycoside phosphotransferase family protein [Actinosynnema sp. NPDC020468]|uniref:phosphotransferase family protein n=1 Tax=Actinosynnema sp. NPDC020468 TaxID=3154488 RepID=UPI0033F41F11
MIARVEWRNPAVGDVEVLARRAFGADARVLGVRELGGGLYNTTCLVTLAAGRAVLRIAPEERRQARIERRLMRNEQAALPHFAPIAAMMPRTLFADWTHDLVDRDYVWQSVLPGVPAVDGIKRYPRHEWQPYYRGLGAITRKVHDVRGERFGPVAGPWFDSWGDAVLALLHDTAADLVDAGLVARDVEQVARIVARDKGLFDAVTEPRLLHGDLWTPNLMLDPDAPEPTVVGVLDHDRASWGDPLADWGLSLLAGKPADARAAFQETYGPTDGPRGLVYRAVHLGAARLERHRTGRTDRVRASYDEMAALIREL